MDQSNHRIKLKMKKINKLRNIFFYSYLNYIFAQKPPDPSQSQSSQKNTQNPNSSTTSSSKSPSPGYCSAYLNKYTSKDQCIYSFIVPKKQHDSCPGLESSVSELYTEIASVKDKMQDLETIIKLMKIGEESNVKIATLEAQVNALLTEKAILQRENSKMESEIVDLKAEVTVAQQMAANFGGQQNMGGYAGLPGMPGMPGYYNGAGQMIGRQGLMQPVDCTQYIETIELYKKIEEQAILAEERIKELEIENAELKLNNDCNQFHKPLPNCDAIYNLGYRRSGKTFIDPDGEGGHDPFTVYCDFESSPIITRVDHDKMDGVNVVGCDDPGCFKIQTDYGAPSMAIKILVQNSIYCSQHIKYDCIDSKLLRDETAYWVSVEKTKQRYWGGVFDESNSCACGINYSCTDPNYKCNCDADSELPLSDEGLLIDGQIPSQNANPNLDPINKKSFNKLPVTGMAFGDVDASRGESGKATLGPLKCYFSTDPQHRNFPTSCAQLKSLGVKNNGFYWIDPDGRLGIEAPVRKMCTLSVQKPLYPQTSVPGGANMDPTLLLTSNAINNNPQIKFTPNYGPISNSLNMANTNLGGARMPGAPLSGTEPKYDPNTWILNSCGQTDYLGPTVEMCNKTYTKTNMENAEYQIKDGIQYFIIKVDGLYKITAKAPSGLSANKKVGRGATITATFSLKEREELRILVGQRSGTKSTSYFGGSGGTFVTKYKDYVYTPLMICGGGGSSSHPEINNQTVTDAHSAKIGKGSSKLGSSFGHGGNEQQGGQRGGARFGAGTSGGGAGFQGNGYASADDRWGEAKPAIAFMKNGAIVAHEASGLGGKFMDKNDISVNGGFGGGGSGGRWSCGGGGGYSGGGGGPDSGHAGGGGSFVNDVMAEQGRDIDISIDNLGEGEVVIKRVS